MFAKDLHAPLTDGLILHDHGYIDKVFVWLDTGSYTAGGTMSMKTSEASPAKPDLMDEVVSSDGRKPA